MDKIEQLHSIIDELRLESRKIQYASALDRLTKRVDKAEKGIEEIRIILLKLRNEGKI